MVTVSFGLPLKRYASFRAHITALVMEVSLLPVLVYGMHCHHVCGTTFCAVTAECSWYQWHYANVDGPQRALSAVGHKAAIICQIRRRLH